MVLTWEQRFADINAMRQRFAAVIADLVEDLLGARIEPAGALNPIRNRE